MQKQVCPCCGRKYETQEDYLKGTSRFRVCDQGRLWFQCSCNSCIVLDKGQFEWYDPADRMSKKAASIFSQIGELKTLPLIPSAVSQLQSVISDPNSSSKDLEKIIKNLPNLALEVIDTANAMKPSSGPAISSIEHAVSFVGRKAISDLVVAISVQGFSFKTQKFSQEEFWEDSVIAGKVAEFIVRKKGYEINRDEAYLAASLLNIGKAVAAMCFGEKTDEVFEMTFKEDEETKWSKAEEKLDAIPHSTLGEVACTLWGFPEYVINCVASHHCMPSDVMGEVSDEIDFLDDDDGEEEDTGPTLQQITALSNQLTNLVQGREKNADRAILLSYADLLGISKAEIEKMHEEFLTEVL